VKNVAADFSQKSEKPQPEHFSFEPLNNHGF
jgi:hypothetical protein